MKDQILELLAEGVSGREIAKRLGVSPSTVSRVKREATEAPEDLQPEDSTGDRARDEYRRMVRALLPVEVRAQTLARLAKDKNPAIALKALEMADEISGLAANQPTQPALVPLFSLPEGTKSPFREEEKDDEERE